MLVLIVVATVAAHFIFVGYVIVGGFLALRWPRTIWLHLGTVAWAAANAYRQHNRDRTGPRPVER